jgi:hypothetical protein
VAIIGKIADKPVREHGGIQYIGQVHQVDIMMLGWCFVCEGFLTVFYSQIKPIKRTVADLVPFCGIIKQHI